MTTYLALDKWPYVYIQTLNNLKHRSYHYTPALQTALNHIGKDTKTIVIVYVWVQEWDLNPHSPAYETGMFPNYIILPKTCT